MELDTQIADAIMERPTSFRIGERIFYLYPMTLGKLYLMQRIMETIGIDKESIRKSAELELLRVVKQWREQCCELLSYMTARNDYYAVFDMEAFTERSKVFEEQDDGDIASLLLFVLTADRTEAFIKHLGIDIEQKNMRKVMKVKEKSDKNSFTFGGVSLYGSLIDVAMERYSLTKRQIVWELDYTSLRLLLADKVNSIYVSDEERKRIHIPKDRRRVNGDDKNAMLQAIKSQSWE